MATVARLWLLIILSVVASDGLAKTASTVFDIAAQSTVIVFAHDESGEVISQGSGVALPSGDIATNCHVLKGGSRFSLRYQKVDHPATRRNSDWDRDVCTIASSTIDVLAVTLGSTRTLKVGARVYAIGAPQGLELTLSDGLVAALRDVPGGQYVQTTAPISPGSSGGGLFDEEGRLLGLITFYLSEGQNLNFALPVEWVSELPSRHVTQHFEGKSSNEWLNRAIELDEEQKYDELLEHSLSWVSSQPKNALAWLNLGITYVDSGQTAKAVGACQQASQIDPEYAAAWRALGDAYSESDQAAKAVKAYQQAIRIDPDYTEAWYNLGITNAKSRQTTQAVEAFRQALRIDPEYAKACYNLGVVYGDLGQSTKEVEAYQHALRIDPEYANAWYNLGVTYAKSDEISKVMDVYRHLQALDQALAAEFFDKVVLP